jgi:hypothetical protein
MVLLDEDAAELENTAVLLDVTLLDAVALDGPALEDANCDVAPATLVEDARRDALEDAKDEEAPIKDPTDDDAPLEEVTAPPLELDVSTRGRHRPSWHSLPRSHSCVLLQVLRQLLSRRTKPSGHGAHAAPHRTTMMNACFTAACMCMKRNSTAPRIVRAA